MRVTGIDWTARMVEDYEGVKRFFVEKLGLPLAFEVKKNKMSHFRFPSGQLLEIYGPNNRDRQPEIFNWYNGHAIGLNVQDLPAARQKMVERDVHFIQGIETWKDEAWSMFIGPEETLMQIQTPGQHHAQEIGPLKAFSWFGLSLKNFEAGCSFFSKVMEMPISERDDAVELAQFRTADGHMLEIMGPKHPWHHLLKHITIGFDVLDLRKLRDMLQEKGLHFLSNISYWDNQDEISFFLDPEDYPYALRERKIDHTYD